MVSSGQVGSDRRVSADRAGGRQLDMPQVIAVVDEGRVGGWGGAARREITLRAVCPETAGRNPVDWSHVTQVPTARREGAGGRDQKGSPGHR